MQPWESDPIVSPSAPPAPNPNAPWQSDPIVQPAPKVPDVSGVQRMAQDNLAANDNKPVTEGEQVLPPSPIDRVSTAAGLPIDKIVNGTIQPSDVPAANRAQYVKALDNGSASNSGDWMQSMLRTSAIVAAGAINRTEHPLDTLEESGQAITSALKGGAALPMFPFLSEDSKQELLENGTFSQLSDYANPEKPTATELARRGIELEQSTFGKAMGGFYAPAAAISPALSPLIESAGGRATKPGEVPTLQSLIPGAIGVGMDIGGGLGLYHGAGQLAALRAQRSAGPLPAVGAGAWDASIREAVAKQLAKPVPSVTPQDVDQHIAENTSHLHPPDSDFKSVATVTGIPESGLKTIYMDTGVTPEKIFTDSQQNPQIAVDVAAGKVPEQYEHLVEQRPTLPVNQAEGLHIARDEATRSFNVVDRDGDHVRGGFDSYEEAQQHIEDMRYESDERAAIEHEKVNEPITEKTPAGEQTVILGAERISDRELAERNMAEPLRGGAESVGGLFGDEHKQGELLSSSAPESESKYTLKLSTPEEIDVGKSRPGRFTYSIEDENGYRGFLDIDSIKDGVARIGDVMIMDKDGNTSNSVGPAVVRNLLDQLRQAHPEITDISGFRASGARTEGRKTFGQEGQEVKTKLPTKNVIPPSEIGKPTSLRTFLSNNGAKFNEGNELLSIKRDGTKIMGLEAQDFAHQIAKEQGYLPPDNPNAPSENFNELRNTLTEKNGGRESFRDKDEGRLAKTRENAEAKKWQDPSYVEHEAANAGLDTERVAGETDKQYTNRLIKALQDFYHEQAGSSPVNLIRKGIGDTIIAAEKFVGKLTGGLFKKLGEGYIKTFQPELSGDKALRADAYMAKYKAEKQEAENSYYRQSAAEKAHWDKLSSDERMQWLYDHETGRWNEEDDPDHARYEALYDAMFKEEKKAIGGDEDKGYKENYLPHQWEKPDEVMRYFRSEPMVRKYGADWFTKASAFKLVQEAYRAGFKLKTDNPESMLVARQLASHDMIATMDMLHNLENDGIAKPARAFSVDKRIAKTQQAITDLQSKYKTELAAIEKQSALTSESGKPIGEPVSKTMQKVQERLSQLQRRLADFTQEKANNKLTPQQMAELKNNSFKVIGSDSKVWQIHQEAGPLWKNAMESKGLWENQGVAGDAYRFYNSAKAIWTQVKLGLSLFHPIHVAMINLASGVAAMADHAIQSGKISDLGLTLRDTGAAMGLTKNTFKFQDHPAVRAWNTAPEARTPEQAQMVKTMVEGGFKPTMSARDTIHFKENFDKAINGIGPQNLRLLVTAASLPGTVMKPFFEHWIPGMKSEIYLRRAELAMQRDPSLAQDAGRRGEVLRQIAKDTDRTYGEMNNEVQFWNKTLRDSFNAAFISGGWKLAQIYNARGLLEPAKLAYKFAKTGEFSKSDVTFNMLHAYAYTGMTLALGGAINTMLGNPIGNAKDTVWDIIKNLVAPQTGEKNPDGTPIRLNQPAFAKEAYNLAHEINTKGLMGGIGSFLYHQTLLPGIVNTLSNQDFTGRKLISDPSDLHQWMNAGWDMISPISVEQYQKAEAKHSDIGKVAGILGFPTAGVYINQTPFEQKVIALYDEQNPPKDDVYSSKLKADLKYGMAKGDTESVEKTKDKMKAEGMTGGEISHAAKVYTKPFVDTAWKQLPIADQRRLIESASEEEKQKFKLKAH